MQCPVHSKMSGDGVGSACYRCQGCQRRCKHLPKNLLLQDLAGDVECYPVYYTANRIRSKWLFFWPSTSLFGITDGRCAEKRRAKELGAQYQSLITVCRASQVDLQLESGEYFLSQPDRRRAAKAAEQAQQAERVAARQRQRQAAFVPPKVSPAVAWAWCRNRTVAVWRHGSVSARMALQGRNFVLLGVYDSAT